MMCTELPENGSVGVSYRTVLRDSTKIAEYITSVMKKDDDGVGDFVKPRTVAHLTEPGSEYLASMWGVSVLHLLKVVEYACITLYQIILLSLLALCTDLGKRVLHRAFGYQS